MIHIEMIGPSGVGKTTLYNFINGHSNHIQNFITKREAMIKAAKKITIQPNRTRLYLLQKLLKSRIIKQKELGIARTILFDRSNLNQIISRKDYLRFQTSFQALYLCLREETNPMVVVKKLGTIIKKFDEFLVLNTLSKENQPVLFDEGIAHYLEGLHADVHNRFTFKEIKEDPALNPGGIIFCIEEPVIIFQRALKRKQEGVRTFSQGNLTKPQLREFVEEDVKMLKAKVEFYKLNKIPVLTLNPGNGPEQNLKEIISFIS